MPVSEQRGLEWANVKSPAAAVWSSATVYSNVSGRRGVPGTNAPGGPAKLASPPCGRVTVSVDGSHRTGVDRGGIQASAGPGVW